MGRALAAGRKEDIMRKRAYIRRRKTAALLVMGLLTVMSPVSFVSAEQETSVELSAIGTYQVPDGWSEVTSASSEITKVYRPTENLELDASSEITCSYMATNYSVMEYEQLRDMLTNDMVYGKVGAEISSTCTYTDKKDNLFILTADDESKEYREIVYYVAGEKECFCVEVKEYRAEAESTAAAKKKTPEEIGKEIAAKFSW